MKMKEVCAATGLTRRTIIFYEEQGLIAPEKTRMNGREYRNYSEVNVKALLDIAALRKCRFSIEEIRQMQIVPESVSDIFHSYKDRLMKEKSELDALVDFISEIPESNLCNIEILLDTIRKPASALPLPKSDCTPHFRYIDSLEAQNKPRPKVSKFHRDQRAPGIDQKSVIGVMGLWHKRQLDDLKDDLDASPAYPVTKESSGPKWLEWLEIPLILLLILLILSLISGRASIGELVLAGLCILFLIIIEKIQK